VISIFPGCLANHDRAHRISFRLKVIKDAGVLRPSVDLRPSVVALGKAVPRHFPHPFYFRKKLLTPTLYPLQGFHFIRKVFNSACEIKLMK